MRIVLFKIAHGVMTMRVDLRMVQVPVHESNREFACMVLTNLFNSLRRPKRDLMKAENKRREIDAEIAREKRRKRRKK